MANKIVTDDVLTGVISKVKGALSNKSDTGHTHDEYVTNIELEETNIPISSITAPKNSYDENSSENIPNANVDPDTGEVIDQTLEGATLSHKIKVNAGDTYNLSVPRLVLLFVLYYDSSDLMLDMQDVNGMTFDIVMPQGVSYLRIYNPYGYDITGITFTRYDEVTKRLEEMANHNHDNTYYRKELIDQTKFVEGYLNDETGEVEDGNDYKITDFIRVYPNMEYIYVFSNLGDTMCFYDENKNFVESHNAMHFTEDRTVKEITFTPPEGAYYLRTLASFHDSAHLLSLKLKDDLIEIIDDLNFLPFKPREGNLYDKNSAENKPNYGIVLNTEVITPSPYDGYEVTHKISLKGGFSYSVDFKANSYLLMALLNANGNLIKRYYYNNSTTTSHKIKNIQDDCYLIMELRISDNSKDDLIVTEINSMDLKADTDHIHLEYIEDITDLNSLVANGTHWFYMPDEILNAPNDAPREGLSYCLEVKDFDIGWYGTQVLTNTLGDMWIRGNECEEWSEWKKVTESISDGISNPSNLYHNNTLKERTYDGVNLIIREGTHLYFNGECTASESDFHSPSPYEIPLIIGQEYEVELKILSGSYSFTPDYSNYFKFELWNGNNYVTYNRAYDGEQFFGAPLVFTASQEVATQYEIDTPIGSTFTDLEVELIIRERPYVRTGVDADEITTSKLKIGNYVLSHDNTNDTLDINYGG